MPNEPLYISKRGANDAGLTAVLAGAARAYEIRGPVTRRNPDDRSVERGYLVRLYAKH